MSTNRRTLKSGRKKQTRQIVDIEPVTGFENHRIAVTLPLAQKKYAKRLARAFSKTMLDFGVGKRVMQRWMKRFKKNGRVDGYNFVFDFQLKYLSFSLSPLRIKGRARFKTLGDFNEYVGLWIAVTIKNIGLSMRGDRKLKSIPFQVELAKS